MSFRASARKHHVRWHLSHFLLDVLDKSKTPCKCPRKLNLLDKVKKAKAKLGRTGCVPPQPVWWLSARRFSGRAAFLLLDKRMHSNCVQSVKTTCDSRGGALPEFRFCTGLSLMCVPQPLFSVFSDCLFAWSLAGVKFGSLIGNSRLKSSGIDDETNM